MLHVILEHVSILRTLFCISSLSAQAVGFAEIFVAYYEPCRHLSERERGGGGARTLRGLRGHVSMNIIFFSRGREVPEARTTPSDELVAFSAYLSFCCKGTDF